MKKTIQISQSVKEKIAKYRDELIGFIFLLLVFNTVFIGVVYFRQTKSLKNQGTMLVNDSINIYQNSLMLDSISIKWRKSYKNLKLNGTTKETRSN